ncbi:MAG: pilus assembly protein PilP [Pseudomonadota bacterium]|nr:pilus assembly protein PilP [Pseudomonadota bacterium]
MRFHLRLAGIMGLLSLLPLLAGFKFGANTEDLRAFTENAFKDHVPEVEPLPAVEPYALFVYTASEMIDPFSPKNLQQQVEEAEQSGAGPDRNRRKEPLEQYPLDSLQMVGTLDQNAERWVILQAPDSSVHRVRVGNYAGQNYGRIIDIEDSGIKIVETVRGPTGKWGERQAAIALLE